MIKNFSAVIVFSLCFLFISCKSKDKGGSGPAYSIKMRLAKGDKFGQDMDMGMDMGIKMPGMDMNMKMNMNVNMNHLHLSVPDLKKARSFYEEFFGFRFAFEEPALLFLRDSAGFLLALHELKAGEKVEFPKWFHFGFCVENRERVKELHAKLKNGGVEFARDLTEETAWANFYCWAPGPYKLEVSWDQGDR